MNGSALFQLLVILGAFSRQAVIPAKDPQLLVLPINESSKHASTSTLAFMTTVVFLSIIAAGTRDDQLVSAPFTLPSFNVGIPIIIFYYTAPLVVIFLHLNILIQHYFTMHKITKIPSSEDGAKAIDQVLFVPSVSTWLGDRHPPVVLYTLKLMSVIIMAALPIICLLLIQVKFIPYHSAGITLLHRLLVFSDIAFIWIFSLIRPRSNEDLKRRTYGQKLNLAISTLATMAILLFSNFVAVVPETCENSFRDTLLFGHRSLRVTDKVLTLQEPPSHFITLPDATKEDLDRLWANFSRGLRLTGRDFRCANFTGSKLFNADFRGSDLTSAKFSNASLQGAKFSGNSTILKAANFTGANVREANFQGAHLEYANFDGADMRATNLAEAALDGATLSKARLFAANLKSASLRGAFLKDAALQGADLSTTTLEYAIFKNAHLEGAIFFQAQVVGAEFMGASLQGAKGLRLQGVDLHQAKVAHAYFCDQIAVPERLTVDLYIDLRDLDFSEKPWPNLEKLNEGLTGIRSFATDAATARIKNAEQSKTCLLPEELLKKRPIAIRHALYHQQDITGPLSYLPEPTANEEVYFSSLASYLLKASCQRDSITLRQIIARRALERLSDEPEDMLAKRIILALWQEMRSPTCSKPFNPLPEIRTQIIAKALS